MIAYFDTSALIKVLVQEDGGDVARDLWARASAAVTATIAYAEARAALAAALRTKRLSRARHTSAVAGLDSLFDGMTLIQAGEDLCRGAGALAQKHGLRGCDAIHLAAALAAGTDGLLFVAWDRELSRAAGAEGLVTAGIES